MRWFWIVVSLTLVASPVSAQTKDESLCMSRDRAVQIGGCTALIQSGEETPAGLAVAYSNRGTAYADEGKYAKAIADLTKAIALAPNDPTAYNGRAWAWHLEGEDAKGLPGVDKAIALAPGNPDSFETRGEIYEKLARRELAIADYRAVLKFAAPRSEAQSDARAGLKRLGVAF
jgi:tetratricopeptide (TPR) repeat protein